MQSTKLRNGPPSSPNHNKNQKNRGSKSTDRASPRNLISEKKHTSKVSELVQLQEELKRTKDQLSSTEAHKRRAEKEAEESRMQVISLSAKLEDAEQQLIEQSDSENARIHELRKLSQERDRSWESEVESLQKQHAADTSALSSAMNEVQRLKRQLSDANESEATQITNAESAQLEVQILRGELSETLDLVQKMKHELSDANESEARANEALRETQMQLKAAKEAAEEIRLDCLEAKEAYNSLASELEQSKAQSNTLEILVSNLQQDLACRGGKNSTELEKGDEIESLRSALEASEARYQNEYIQSTLQIRSAYERAKSESSVMEAELMEELEKAKVAVEELKCELASKELSMKKLSELKSELMDKETQLQTLEEENEALRGEIDVNKGDVIEEKLYATQMANSELESEMRMVKVQADQWRKAAEAAAALISPATVCVDVNGMKMESPFLDSMEDDALKKKNANMLKKIGGLWKKGQK